MPDTEAGCELYAVIKTGEGARERLDAALHAAHIASVLIAPGPAGALDAASARPLIELAQRRSAAALVADDAKLARDLRADGVHLSTAPDLVEAYRTARAIIGSAAVIGIDPGISRHEAMTLAEAGADYVGFGAPARLKDHGKGRQRRDELVAWWGEIFQVPCVAFDVESAEEAQALAEAGADFVAVTLPAAQSPAAARELVAAVAAAIGARETAS